MKEALDTLWRDAIALHESLVANVEPNIGAVFPNSKDASDVDDE